MKSLLVKLALLLILLGAGTAAVVSMTGGLSHWYLRLGGTPSASYRTAPVVRENLLASISASGTVEPEDVIDVGAQVVGQIKEFGPDLEAGPLPNGSYRPVDFRSRVKKGMILAKLDDALFKARQDKAQADARSAEAHVRLLEAKSHQAERDWQRAQELHGRQAMSNQDYDTAHTTFLIAKADMEDARAAANGAQAALNEARQNMEYTTIYCPVVGEILDRRVNVGQTVVSGLNAPSLFLIATDLRRMQVWASINEADIGQIHEGQSVRFTVDAYPNRSFEGVVSQIRLNANMTQNVVTYTVVVSTDNSPGLLKPYMTANLQFKVEERSTVLQVPNSALRYRPQAQLVAADCRDEYLESLERRPSTAKDKNEATNEKKDQATVWERDHGFLRPIKVRIGLTDGNMTEILEGEVREGDEVVTGEVHAVDNEGVNNPFTPKFNSNKK
jgi:HlyD family secretion protein